MDFKALRAKRNDKARSLIESSGGKVDASTFTPAELLNADAKTGMRPISRRAFKAGGKVEGEAAKTNLSRSPRGFQEKVGLANTNQKDANEEREGVKHVGGFKRGGRTGYQDAGVVSGAKLDAVGPTKTGEASEPMTTNNGRKVSAKQEASFNEAQKQQAAWEAEQRAKGDMTRRASGGRTAKASGGSDDKYVEGKDYEWVNMANQPKGGTNKTRHFFSKAEKAARAAPAAAPAAASAPAPKKANSTTSAAPKTSPMPPKRPAATIAAPAAAAAQVPRRTRNSQGYVGVQEPMNYAPAKNTSSSNLASAAGAIGTTALGAGLLAAGARNRPANVRAAEVSNVTNPKFGRGKMGSEGFQGQYQTGVSRPTGGSRTGMIMGQDPMFNAIGGGGFGALEQINDETKRLYKRGGKAEKFEGSAKDEAQDKKLAAKRKMTMAEWEASKADEKHDSQKSVKGLKAGGRTAKMGGGGMEMLSPAARLMKDPKSMSPAGMLASGMKKGGKADEDHDKDCACKACGGRMARATGGRAGKGKTNIVINVMPHTANKPAAGIQPPMPPMPPVGGPPPMGDMPPPRMSLPPGLGAAMAGAAGTGPMPPPGGAGPMPPMMGRKSGGKVYPKMKFGAGSGEGRLEKIEKYGKNA